MNIILSDDSSAFDAHTLASRPIGGAETAFIQLAETLASRGHQVTVVNRCDQAHEHRGVSWIPLTQLTQAGDDLFADTYTSADVHIANRSPYLLDRGRRAQKIGLQQILWLHNPATYLRKPRYLWRLLRHRPTVVFSGPYHQESYPTLAPNLGKAVIPYGLDQSLLDVIVPSSKTYPPVAVFTSNPMRNLDWLLEIWTTRIHPAVPEAELHVYGGSAVYGGPNSRHGLKMEAILDQARAAADQNVILKGALPKSELLQEISGARMMLYRGDEGETFCYALAEAQALGLPCVVQNIGCVAERIHHKETGFVAQDDADFAHHAITLFKDEDLWQSQHLAALEHQRQWTWDQAAIAFEKLFEQKIRQPRTGT